MSYNFISVGIDVGSEISWASIVLPSHEAVSKPIKIDHKSIESLEAFKRAIKKAEELNSMKARIFLESTGVYHHALCRHLSENGFEVSILNPLITDSNKNQGIRKVKTDKTDAKRIAITAYTSGLKVSLIPSDAILEIRAMTREYHKIVDARTAHLNQITKELVVVFPRYVGVFSSVLGKTSKAILRKYYSPKNILEASKEELLELIKRESRKGGVTSLNIYNKLIDAAKLAVVFSHQLQSSYEIISMKLDLIELLEKQKARVIERIHGLLERGENQEFAKQVNIVESIKGVGFISAVSLMGEVGDYSAFAKPNQLVAYFGVDPAVKQSGKFKGTQVKMSKRGSSIARRILFIIAVAAIRKTKTGEPVNPVIFEFYEKKLLSKAKKVALGAVMRKMTNIIFAVLRDQKEFRIITPEEHQSEYLNKTSAA
jgi:transposase